MVLRLFSKSSKTQPETPKETSAPPSSAGPDELAQAARDATSNKDRQTLISRITDTATLKELAKAPGCLAGCADQLATVANIETALSVAAHPAASIELAIHTHNGELRERQIDKIVTEEALVELEHASRSKNKACNRLARARLERLRKARIDATEASELCKNLAQQALRLDQDAHITARFDALAQKHAAASAAHATSQELLTEFQEQAPVVAAMPSRPEASAPKATAQGPDFRALSAVFSTLEEKMRADCKASDLAEEMKLAAKDWQAAIARSTPDASAIDAVTKCSALYETLRSCENLLAARLTEISELLADAPTLNSAAIAKLPRDQLTKAWAVSDKAKQQAKTIAELTKGVRYPKDFKVPTEITKLEDRKEVLSALITASRERKQQTEHAFKDQVKLLEQALDAGELKRAEAARGEARALQEALPPSSGTDTRKRYGALIASMQNLRDWQHFATDPKREELYERMTKLAENPKDPDEQADLVKELRTQWNALGGKGPKDIAKRFDDAAAKAFEPCRLHYAELAKTRAANLETRKQILAQLETFVSDADWASADLAGARTILNSARTEWRQAFPIERGANRSLEKRFKTATDALYANLQDGWSENLAAKEKLVTTAEALLDSQDPLTARLDVAKRLQQDWKQTGPVPRGPDQKLWKRFRAACDALFSTRDEERNQAQATYAAQQTAANARLDEFEKDLGETSAETLERSLLASLKRDLDEIENLDRSVIKRARDLEDQFKNKLKQKADAQKESKLVQLCRLDEQAARCEAAGQTIPTDLLELDARFGDRTTAADNAHLDLVLSAETQAGIESPAADSQRRLELQVQQLNAGMNSGARKALGGMELAEQWCALKASNSSDALRERLFAAAKTLLTARQ